ncbi:YdcF family protein [Novacetimonas hansenii]|uniref:YdcF family protein n=1 Tax=Novacetimonas hansenii TaxID=436 RepID=UPI0017810E98|nr:YdcF family protein [Novacetimonas hansenii]QOF94397.1 YdcF family protein [Novacetimonas hansenii]
MKKILYKTSLVLVCVGSLSFSLPAVAQELPQIHDHVTESLQRRIFPQLSAMIADAGWRKIFFSDQNIQKILQDRRARFSDITKCIPAPHCVVEAWKITPDERRIIGEVLGQISSHLPVSRGYGISQWEHDADAINYILSVYGEGSPPHYPHIDAMTQDTTSKDFNQLISGLQLQELQNWPQQDMDIFSAPLRYAAILLDMNDRDDAIHFPMLWQTWNAPALHLAQNLDWRHYPYTAIIVPGAGPEAQGVSLSAMGKLRLMLAVDAFRKKQAPFILVSGGAVHPAQTHYVEAQEMRRELISRFGIAERNIIIEPYARHTTTNLRNASRLLATMNAPRQQPALIVTDQDQSAYIASQTFAHRNLRELGCAPGVLDARISLFAIPFHPDVHCNVTDPMDPLDP